MSRLLVVVGLFQIACLQTEAIEMSSDTARDGAEEASAETTDEQDTIEPSLDAQSTVCMVASPTRLSFSTTSDLSTQMKSLNILSCGSAPLVIDDVVLSDTADGQFEIVDVDTPITLAPGQTFTVHVSFRANVPAAGPSNAVATSTIVITSNAPQALSVTLEGFITTETCPTAVIEVAEGNEVQPQTNLHLTASASTAAMGDIVGYEWSVLQPNGSVSTFMPSASVVAPTFEANIVGTYAFRLVVIDAFGNRSCVPAEYEVKVLSDDAIRVEVRWDTPGDPDPSDTNGPSDMFSVGSDVDLHFLHPKANDELFSSFDCYVGNANPEWGIFAPSDNPRLERDDRDGAGPEYLALDVPEQAARYQVVVHYFDDWGYGDSDVTVRVYIYGILRDEWTTTLTMSDRWDTHTIDWPSGIVARMGDGAPQIEHGVTD